MYNYVQMNERGTKSFYRHRNLAGFTILEILVVLGITVMLIGMTLVYRQVTQRQVTLYVEVQKLAGVILRAKSLAVATQSGGASVPAGFKICGYGVKVDYTANAYSLFSYRIPVAESCNNIVAIITTENDRVGEISLYALDSGVQFDNVQQDSISAIVFVPPEPKTLISLVGSRGALSSDPGRFYLKTRGDEPLAFQISVNAFGQVNF